MQKKTLKFMDLKKELYKDMKFIIRRFKGCIKDYIMGYNHEKYWRRRDKIFDKNTNSILKAYYKLYIRHINLKQNADINFCTNNEKNNFLGRPFCPHGLNGIVIAGGAVIGKKCFLSHQVTIGRSNGLAPVIVDNVYIGPGAKIFGGIKIGNNVRIGANCVVFEDIPDNATVVLQKPRTIIKSENYSYYTFKIDERIDENE